MNITRPCFLVLASILIVSAGCQNSEDVIEGDGLRVVIANNPAGAGAEEPVLITVNAHNDRVAIKSVSIDYTGDGTWDDVRDFDAYDIDAEFIYIYSIPATYVVRIEVRDANDLPTIKTMALTIGEARNVAVSYFMLGVSAEGGTCSAQGPPAQCAGCSAPLTGDPAAAARRPLGIFARNSTVQVAQGFSQWPYASGQDVLYSCRYELRLVAGAPPLERTFGTGSCTTNSGLTPAVLMCSVTAGGVVP